MYEYVKCIMNLKLCIILYGMCVPARFVHIHEVFNENQANRINDPHLTEELKYAPNNSFSIFRHIDEKDENLKKIKKKTPSNRFTAKQSLIIDILVDFNCN